MKKFTRYLSLFAMALLTALPALAGGVTSLDEISSKAAYVIKSARGYMVYAPQYAPDFAWCSQNNTNGATPIDVNENEPNNQWAIINSPKGFSYLWNVGAQKFLYKKDAKTVFSANPLGGDLNFLASTGAAKADYPWVVAFGGNQLNMSTNQANSIFSNWNSTADEGNMVEIRKVADLADDVLSAANAAIAEYEKDIVVGISSLDQLKADKSYYVMNPRGDWAYVPEYSVEGQNVGANMLVASKMAGVAASLPAANKQFVFVKATSGNRYLYSVGAQKYVAVSTNEGETGAALVDAPVEKLNFLAGQGSKLYPWVLALGDNQIGVSPNYKNLGGIITFWNDLKDEGNNVMVVEGDAFAGSLLEGDVNAYEEGLKVSLATALDKANEVLAKVNNGELNATEEQKSALNDAVNAAKGANILNDDYLTLISNLNAAVEAIPAESVPANSFVCSKIVPAAGEVKSLKEFTLTFSNKLSATDYVGGVDVKKKAILRDADGIAVATGVVSFDASKSSADVKVVLNTEVSAPGTYTLALREGTVYNSKFNAEQADFGVAAGALYNPAVEYNFTIAGAAVEITPDPAGQLQEVPAKVTMTFPNDIQSVDMAMVNLGMGNQFMLDPSAIVINKNVVTLSLPVEDMKSAANFSLLLEVVDVNGDYITYGDYDVDMVYVEYEVSAPANRYSCREISPAEGKVNVLNKFDIALYDPTNPWGGYIGAVDASKKVVLRDEWGDVVANGSVAVNFDDMSSVATITLSEEIGDLGDYTLVIPEGTFYNQNYDENAADKGVAANGAIYNPELRFAYTIAGANVVVNPDPAKGALKSVPNEITFTFEKEIKSVEEAMVVIGMGSVIPVDEANVTVNGKVVTIKLPVENMKGLAGFSLAFVATDVDGNVLTYGTVGQGYIGVDYEIEVPANSYLCSNIVPAVGEVKTLKDFTLTFVNNASVSDFVGGVDAKKKAILRDADGIAVATGVVTFDPNSFGSDVQVSLDKEINAPGSYTLALREGTVYNSNFNADQPDFGVENLGALYNPALEFNYTIAGDAIVINPDPAKQLSEVPAKVTMTFANDIQSVDMAMVNLGMGNQFMLDPSAIVINKNVVTLALPLDQMKNVAEFSLLLEVADVDGEYLTYGDYDEGMVYVEYTVAAPANRFACKNITPAAGKVETLNKFELTLYDPTNPWGGYIGAVDAEKKVVLRDEWGDVVAKGNVTVDFDNMSSVAVITLSEEIADLGDYTLVVPEGTFYNQNYDENAADKGVEENGAIYNPELTFAYTIAGANVVVNPDPANGMLKTVPAEISFTFENDIKSAEEAMVVIGMGSVIPLEANQVSVNGKVVTLKMPVANMDGIAGFSVAFVATDVDGKVLTYGDVGPGYVGVSYEIEVPANSYKCTAIDPEEGDVASLKTFKLTFTNNSAMFGDNIGGVDASKEVVLKDKDGNVVAKGTVSVDFDAWSSDAVITLDKEINAAGQYTLVVPEATIYNSSYNEDQEDKGVEMFGAIYNPALNFTYNVVPTGIEGIFAEDADVKVYNLKGILVAKSLKNLPKGIYIVNGKKVIVK